MSHQAQLLAKVRDHSAIIGIYGMGYVGLPLAIAFIEAGFRVIGFDIDKQKVLSLSEGESYLPHIGISPLLTAADRFRATADYSQTANADVLIICVPTPLDKHRHPDLSYVTNTVDSIAPWLQPGQMVSLESTTYPGTTEEQIKPRIEARDLKVGDDVFLVYSPEREDPEGVRRRHRSLPRRGHGAVLGGHRQSRARQLGCGSRDEQAAGEHSSCGQHRPGQRTASQSTRSI